MADSLTFRFFYAGIIFNILFSVFGFAFTAFPSTYQESLELPIDQDVLYSEGIVFVNATYYNLSYNANWTYFTQGGNNMRISFRDGDFFFDPDVKDGIIIQEQTLIGQYLDSWALPVTLQIEIGKNYEEFTNPKNLSNSTIVTYFEPQFNWTRFRAPNAINGFVITLPEDENNITKAVYETGILSVIVGELQINSDLDVATFARWYWSSLFNFGYSGFPSMVQWILKLIVAINLVSAIFAIRELFRV